MEIVDVRWSHPCEERDRYENDCGEHPLFVDFEPLPTSECEPSYD